MATSNDSKWEDCHELAKTVTNQLYRDLQKNIDEPLNISHLTQYLRRKMNWSEQKVKLLHQEMDLSSNNVEYSDIVEYLAAHKPTALEMEQWFSSHPVTVMPRVASLTDMRGAASSVSQYFDRASQARFQHSLPNMQQAMPMMVPPQFYFYGDQASGVAVTGTSSGTVYENPLFHGHVFASPTANKIAGSSARRALSSHAEEYDVSEEDELKSSDAVSSDSQPQQQEPYMDMEAWVRHHNGNRVIKKLLIANNGIAAVKCIKYMRVWCYTTFGDMNAIHFVCMATPEDIASNAEYIRMADEVVPVPGGSNNYNYANVTTIATIAAQTKCDAVWPGWGHASEYPSLPRTLQERDIGWLGPDADAMYASGDKIMSTLIAQHAKVPTVPWSGSGIAVKYKRGDMSEVEAGFKKSCVSNLQQALDCATRIGYPVMIKASEGGGGKGIRKCDSEQEMSSAYNQVVNEVPGSPVFIMKLASNARHLEVQLLADSWGNVIALFGRDCSMQRRHQKIIEEGPVINVDDKLLLEMEASAVALAKSVHYVGAGTVEFLYDNDSKCYYFLELNPRLQVEHTVTELISDVNLPACQLMVAMGIPLHCMSDIRRLYQQTDIHGTNTFALSTENRLRPRRHAIACRITAENPMNNFAPTSGHISELHFRSMPNVWGYFSLKSQSSIHDYADSQFGHIFASGQTRDEARRAMVTALSQLEIRGEIRTTIEFLSSVLENAEYKAGKFHTTWLEQQMAKKSMVRVPSHLTPEKIVLLGVVANGDRNLSAMHARLMGDLEHGRNINKGKYTDALVACPVELIYHNVKYRVLVERTSDISYTLRYKQWRADVMVRGLSDGGRLVSLDGRTHVLYATWNQAEQLVLCVDGHTVVFEQEYDPSNITATMPGKLVKILIQNGQHIEKGAAFAEIEVMKMYMPLVVPESGVIDVIAMQGSILQIGQSIARLQLDDSSQVNKASVYEKTTFTCMSEPEKTSVRVDRRFARFQGRVECMLDGFIAATDIDKEYVRDQVDFMMNALRDPRLPLDEFNSALEPLHGRIDDSLFRKFQEKVQLYEDKLKRYRFRWEKPETFPSEVILGHIDAFKQRLSPTDLATFEATIDPIKQVCHRHRRGTHHYAVQVISELMETFYIRESRFIDKDENVVIQQLRREAPNNLENVAVIARSHFQLKHREKVIMELLNIVDSIFYNRMYEFISELTHVLEIMTNLTDIKYGRIHLKCREILASIDVSSESQRKMEIENVLKSHPSLLQRNLSSGSGSGSGERAASSSSSSVSALASPDLTDLRKSKSDLATNVSMNNRQKYKTRDLFNDDGLLHAIPDLLEILPKYMLSENRNVACNAVELWVRSVFAPPFYFVDKRSMSVKWDIEESTQCTFSFSTVNPNDVRIKRRSLQHSAAKKDKLGFFGFFANLRTLKANFKAIIENFPPKESLPVHAIILGFSDQDVENFSEKEFTVSMEKFFTPYRGQLNSSGISFISVFVPSSSSSAPHLFTFRYMLDFREDPMTRHIMPPLVSMLEMDRLKMGFQIQWMPTENRRIHVFEASPLKKKLFTRNWDGRRLFARVPVTQMVKPSTMVEDICTDYFRFGGPEFALMEATHVLESIISANGINKYRYNHILLACFFDVDYSGNDNDYMANLDLDDATQLRQWQRKVFEYVRGRMDHDYQLFAKQLKRLHVTHIEIRFQIRIQHKNKDLAPFVFRAFLDEPGNGVTNIHLYAEKTSLEDGCVKLLDPGYFKTRGRLHNSDAFAEHVVEHDLMAQRITAKNLQTTYVYDWPLLFEKALQAIWYEHKTRQKDGCGAETDLPFEHDLIRFDEYVLDENDADKRALVKVERAPGQNEVAMVVWKVSMKTPEFPSGRQFIIASNDIANKMGTFSLTEDALYYAACTWAQREGLPFVYLSANSGARIDLSPEVMNVFKVAWAHDEHTSHTVKKSKEAEYEPIYLYLDEETYHALPTDAQRGGRELVNVEKMQVSGKTRYRIRDIVGKYGIGVENLSGSGLIAGATSRAAMNTFTLSYVTGRSVGIGAYLVRLGQRVIQKTDSPILLTGYVALNNLLGKSVYISNQQIGGAEEIMMPNGVTHCQVDDDLEGAYQILKWLSYIPSKQGEAYPIETNLASLPDPIDRDVLYYPESDKYDARCLIAGDLKTIVLGGTTRPSEELKQEMDGAADTHVDAADTSKLSNLVSQEWLSGVFDRDSWTEYMASWATAVVVGRARLGGIPCGVIATETRTTTHVIPPDPALEESSTESSFSQPGQVWYPDSSFKTGQAIRDFKREQLPLFILANWRGFSGGQRDMFHEVLKYGSYIVDELADYQQPVFMYLPPTAELRGGAWVVLDSLINDRVIEMYAAETSKANVLEPTGTVGLKFRKRKLLSTMHRVDPQLVALDAKLKSAGKDESSVNAIRSEIENRERGLFPIYNKIALMYAQLHDTPQRMKDVGVIKQVVFWRQSRRFFYWRLRRKLIQTECVNALLKDMSLKNEAWKQALQKFDEFVCSQFVKKVNSDNAANDEQHQLIQSNEQVVSDNETFVQWMQTQTDAFAKFRVQAQQASLQKKLQSMVNAFDGDSKQLQQLFKSVLSQRNKNNANGTALESDDLVNID